MGKLSIFDLQPPPTGFSFLEGPTFQCTVLTSTH